MEVELAVAVTERVPPHHAPRPELREAHPAHRLVRDERLEARAPFLPVGRRDARGLRERALAAATDLSCEAVVSDDACLRPPRPPEHVVPVRVREEERDLRRAGLIDRVLEVVQLRWEHA